MPFTLLLIRIGVSAFMFLLVGAAISLQGLADLAAGVVLFAVLAGVPVFILEALGVLSGAARFFFGRRD
jgi:hypothetical protein